MTHRTVVFALLLILGAWLVVRIFDIILMVIISFILMSAINPLVDRIEKLKIPRGFSIVGIYILIWVVIAGLVGSLVPPLIDQTARLIRLLPNAVGQFDFFTSHQQEISQQLLARIGSLPENLLKVTIDLFGNLLNVLTTIVITFYLILEHDKLEKHLAGFLGKIHASRAVSLVEKIEARLGHWVRGELFLMFAVGLLTYLGLLALGVDIALPLAIIAGILEIVPNIGPIISAIPAVLVGLTINPLVGLGTVCLYFFVQTLENHLLVPKIMQKAVGVHPLVSILALMIGFRLSGPAGAILSIPIIIISEAVWVEFFAKKG